MAPTFPKAKSAFISKTPGVVGGDACVGNTRISVAHLIAFRRLGATDSELLEGYPSLSQADLDAAWAYYSANTGEIDEAIREDEADDEEEGN